MLLFKMKHEVGVASGPKMMAETSGRTSVAGRRPSWCSSYGHER